MYFTEVEEPEAAQSAELDRQCVEHPPAGFSQTEPHFLLAAFLSQYYQVGRAFRRSEM